jgi:hypothetical protein
MPQHLHVSLKLKWIKGDEYEAEVTTRLTDSCYHFVSKHSGLPHGMVGIPEMAYVTVEYSHKGEICGQVVRDDTQKIDDIHSDGHPLGVTAFVTVNGEVAGSAHQPFPR